MSEPTLHGLDKALAEHLSECAQQNKHMWMELRALKRVIWMAAIAGYATLGAVCGVLLKNHLHL